MIVINQLTKAFRRHRVLDGLSLSIEAGDRVALVGANGAGKTTLIRCLLGEYTYDGDLLVEGRSPRLERREVLKDIGFVPQLPPPLKMPVADLVRFAAVVSATEQSRIVGVLSRLGLELADVAGKPFVKLSGGQKQKILAAIALGRACRLLILDEPTANLDPAARKVLFDLLAAEPERPMLISSHRLEEVVGLVNRVIELDRGKVVLDERIAAAGNLATHHHCRITANRTDETFARALAAWGFAANGDGTSWHGEVAGADRLRFLAMLTRFGGLICALDLQSERADGRPSRSSAAPTQSEDHDVRQDAR